MTRRAARRAAELLDAFGQDNGHAHVFVALRLISDGKRKEALEYLRQAVTCPDMEFHVMENYRRTLIVALESNSLWPEPASDRK